MDPYAQMYQQFCFGEGQMLDIPEDASDDNANAGSPKVSEK